MSTSTKREITASTASTDEFFEPEDCFVDDDLMVSSPNELNGIVPLLAPFHA
jgi:hypothetical protein